MAFAQTRARDVLTWNVRDNDRPLTELAEATVPAWRLVFDDPRRNGVLGLAAVLRDVLIARAKYEDTVVDDTELYRAALAELSDLIRVLAGELVAALLNDDPCDDGVMAS